MPMILKLTCPSQCQNILLEYVTRSDKMSPQSLIYIMEISTDPESTLNNL